MSLRQRTIPPGWDGKKRVNGRGCAVCHEPTEVSISLQARVIREDGRGVSTGLANCSISLCNKHALELWEESAAVIERTRVR